MFTYLRPRNGKITTEYVDPRINGRANLVAFVNGGHLYDGKTKTGIRSKIEEDISYLTKLGIEVNGDPEELKRLTGGVKLYSY